MSFQISVVIPSYNREATLERAIESVLNQSFKPYEVIVVDDGSTDNTKIILEGFNDAVRALTQENGGVSSARNRGIMAAQGNWVALLDSDDAWHPTKLARQVQFLQTNPDIKIVQTDEVWIRNGSRIYPKKYHQKPSGWIFAEMLVRCLVSPSAVMIARSVFDTCGFFDESMPACEDFDLWLRMGSRYEIHNIEEELITKYGGHDDQLSAAHSLDKWRIYSLNKIRNEVPLPGDWLQALEQELQRKCTIYLQGLKKRGKETEGKAIEAILDSLRSIETP